jgi:uncharacterized protein with HEPN domain
MKRTISLYVKDILENMRKAQEFVGSMDCEAFASDEKSFYAVVRCIEIIGEATKNVPAAVRRRYSEIPWAQMAGMRDKVIHFYFGVNFERVWLVVKNDIPKIEPRLEEVLEDLLDEEKTS